MLGDKVLGLAKTVWDYTAAGFPCQVEIINLFLKIIEPILKVYDMFGPTC
jgi:hypothetical protein